METIGIVQNKVNKVTKVLSISFITNVFLSIIKVIFGVIGKSSALIADGIHSFSDLITDIVAIIGSHISRKPADKEHPYGHGRLEYLTSMAIGLVILFLGFKIIYDGPTEEIIIPSLIVIVVSLITIIAKYLLSSYILKKGKEFNNNVLKASGKESRTDVISSLVVLISSTLMQFSDKITILKYADIVATILVGIFIVNVGYKVLKENISIILGEQETDDEYVNKIEKIILENPHIKKVDSVVLLKFGSYYNLIAKLSIDGNTRLEDAHNITKEVKKAIKQKEEKVEYITIHTNPYKNLD